MQTIPNHQNITFTNKTRLGNNFHFKDRIPKYLTSGTVYKFKSDRYLNVRIGEHIGISPLTKKEVKPRNSSVGDHLLLCILLNIQHPMTILVC